MQTIVFRNRYLFISKREHIYLGDNRVDQFRFLIDTVDDYINISNFNGVVQIILPDGKNGALSHLTFEPELYQNRYMVSYLPITKTLTNQIGKLELNLSFFMHDSVNDIYHTMNTNSIQLQVLKSNIIDGSLPSEDETNILSQMQKQITDLQQTKATCMDYNEKTRELTLYSDSNKTKILTVAVLNDDVVWKILD